MKEATGGAPRSASRGSARRAAVQLAPGHWRGGGGGDMNEPERPATKPPAQWRWCAAHGSARSTFSSSIRQKTGRARSLAPFPRAQREEMLRCWSLCQMWIRILCSVSRSALKSVLWRLRWPPRWTFSEQKMVNLRQAGEFSSKADIPDCVNSILSRSWQVQSLSEFSP